MSNEATTVLAIDPGTQKCGIAVMRGDGHNSPASTEVLHHSVVATGELAEITGRLSREHAPAVILIGRGTSAGTATESVRRLNAAPVELVDEAMTSVEARNRYFEENPPRGLRRLLPTSLQTPPEPYDDYVAIILAERYLTSRQPSPHS